MLGEIGYHAQLYGAILWPYAPPAIGENQGLAARGGGRSAPRGYDPNAMTVAPPQPPGAQAQARATLTPQDWLRVAADVLVDKSVEGVRVDVLAKTLAVTRGSFYWHFADRGDLLRRLLQAWKQTQTEQVIAAHNRQGVAVDAVIHELAALPFHGERAQRGGAIELAIRAWARRDDMARAVVDEVDAMRLRYIEDSFAHLGFAALAAKNRAFLMYSYMQSESLFRAQGSDEDKQQRRRFVEQLLTHPDLPF